MWNTEQEKKQSSFCMRNVHQFQWGDIWEVSSLSDPCMRAHHFTDWWVNGKYSHGVLFSAGMKIGWWNGEETPHKLEHECFALCSFLSFTNPPPHSSVANRNSILWINLWEYMQATGKHHCVTLLNLLMKNCYFGGFKSQKTWLDFFLVEKSSLYSGFKILWTKNWIENNFLQWPSFCCGRAKKKSPSEVTPLAHC